MSLEGERALLLYPAGLEFIAAFFGCLYAGVVAVPAYPPRRNRSLSRIQAIAKDAEAESCADHARCTGTRPALSRPNAQPPRAPVAGDRSARHGLEARLASIRTCYGDTLAFLQYTSGSTGTPKGVMLTHANLMHNSALIAYAFEHTRIGQRRVLAAQLPRHGPDRRHSAAALYRPSERAACRRCRSCKSRFAGLQAISRFKLTISGGPNFAYDLCVRKITPEQREHAWT